MRLFIAVDLDDETRKKAAEMIQKIKGLDVDVKFTAPENLHFTLKFLGEVEDSEDRVKEIEAAVYNAIKDIKGFSVVVGGIGYFGNPKHVKTLWVDAAMPGREELVKLASSLNKHLDHIRHEPREPKPHITLGRVRTGKNREALLDFIKKNEHVKLGEMDVNLIKLKKSVLSQEGPHYTDLKAFSLS